MGTCCYGSLSLTKSALRFRKTSWDSLEWEEVNSINAVDGNSALPDSVTMTASGVVTKPCHKVVKLVHAYSEISSRCEYNVRIVEEPTEEIFVGVKDPSTSKLTGLGMSRKSAINWKGWKKGDEFRVVVEKNKVTFTDLNSWYEARISFVPRENLEFIITCANPRQIRCSIESFPTDIMIMYFLVTVVLVILAAGAGLMFG